VRPPENGVLERFMASSEDLRLGGRERDRPLASA
jgi:hypothetical protein